MVGELCFVTTTTTTITTTTTTITTTTTTTTAAATITTEGYSVPYSGRSVCVTCIEYRQNRTRALHVLKDADMLDLGF
jgi:hypothetical protein